MSDVQTDLSQLVTGSIALCAVYHIESPPLLGAPSGSMAIVIKESVISEAEAAVGQITITTDYYVGNHMNLKFTGAPSIDGSTGYTHIDTTAHGIVTAPVHEPKYVNVPIKVALTPTYDAGTLTVGKLAPMMLYRGLVPVPEPTGDSTGNATALPKPVPKVVTKILPYWRR